MNQKRIITAYNTLNELGGKERLPIRTARQMYDLRNALLPTFEFYEDKRREIVTQLGKTNEETGECTVTPENMPKFLKNMKELDGLEVDIPGLPMTINWPENVDILPAHLWALDGVARIVEAEA